MSSTQIYLTPENFPRLLQEQETLAISDAVQKQLVSPLNYVIVALFIIMLGILAYLLKFHMVKFVSFYVLNKDYQRIKALNTKTQNLNHSIIENSNTKSQSFKANWKVYKSSFVQNLNTYHPVLSSIFSKVRKVHAYKFPTMISICFTLIICIILITWSLVLSKSFQSMCAEKRFNANYMYLCSQQTDTFRFSSQVIGTAFYVTLLTLTLTLPALYFLSKNYLHFLRSLAKNDNHQDSLQSDKDLSEFKNMNLPTQQHQPTLQNMLDNDSEFTRRSLKPHQQNQQPQSKNLFQINEDDEEEQPFSPTKNHTDEGVPTQRYQGKSVLGENRNIINRQSSMKKQPQQQLLAVPKMEYDCESINELPQFSSCNKSHMNDESYNGYSETNKNATSQTQLHSKTVLSQIGSSKSNLIRPRSKQNKSTKLLLQGSTSGFSDSSTVMDGMRQDNSSSNKCLNHLEGIEEVDDDMRKSHNLIKERLKDAGFLQKLTPCKIEISQASKEESKDEDSSRIVMINILKNPSDCSPIQQKSPNADVAPPQPMNIIGLIAVVVIAMGIIMCSLYILYSFYNMTFDGLSNVLIIFAFSLFIDFCLLRIVAISIITIFTTKQIMKDTQLSKTSYFLSEEDEKLSLLGYIYEDYERPIQMLADVQEIFVQHQQECYDEEKVCDSMKPLHDGFNSMSSQRILEASKNIQKKRRFGDIVLVESTFFYHQTQLPDFKRPNQQQHQAANDYLPQKQEIKKKKAAGEKVGYTKSITFNAEDLNLQKSHTERQDHQDDSHYDIEEIPMYSSRNAQKPHFIDQCLPNNNDALTTERQDVNGQQFETPKGHKSINGPVNMSSQIITFQNDQLRESNQDQKFLLRDLLLHSGSSRKKRGEEKGQDYQSLKRYLEDGDDKENQCSNVKVRSSQKKESIRSSARKSKYQEPQQENEQSPNQLIRVVQCQEEFINFTPQYSSVHKSLMFKQKLDKSNYQENRKSLALPNQYSDFKNLSICSDLQKSKHSRMKSKQQTLQKDEDKENLNYLLKASESKKTLQTSSKKQDQQIYQSPSHIVENLEQKLSMKKQPSNAVIQSIQPNVSPFNKNAIEEEDTMGAALGLTMDGKDSPRFKVPNMKCNEVSKSQLSLNQHIQPVKDVSNIFIEENSESISVVNTLSKQLQDINLTKTVEDTLDAKAKNLINKLKPQIKPKIKPKKSKDIKPLTSHNDYDTDQSKTMSNALLMLNQHSHESEGEQLSKDLCMDINDSKFEETGRSKMYEDSDSSTFRMISFGRQKSKQTFDMTSNQPQSNFSSQQIDFYSNVPQQVQQDEEQKPVKQVYHYKAQTQEFKQKSKKQSVAEIIVEENEVKTSISPMKIRREIQVLKTDESSMSLQEPQAEEDGTHRYNPYQDSHNNDDEDNDFNLMHQMMQMNDQDNNNFFRTDSNDDLAMKLCHRQPSKLSKKGAPKQRNKNKSHVRSKVSSKMDTESFSSKGGVYPNFESVNLHLKTNEAARKQKEDNELLLLRIEEQRRKLKHFLKLAKQLKSQKDIKKIKDMLLYLKQTQKPLPYAKMQELKQLEIMSSPYNQSLIAMLKDEYEQHKKNERPPTSQNKKAPKSQTRADAKSGQVINKLNGIYGHQVGQFLSNRAKSRDSSIDHSLKPSTANKLQQKSRAGSNAGRSRQPMNRLDLTNQSSTMYGATSDMPQVIEIRGMTTSEEGESTYDDAVKKGHISRIEMDDESLANVNDSVEFNDLQNFMSQQQRGQL